MPVVEEEEEDGEKETGVPDKRAKTGSSWSINVEEEEEMLELLLRLSATSGFDPVVEVVANVSSK